MVRTIAGLPVGTRVSDCIGRGVVTKTFSLPLIRRILVETERTSYRELPAHAMVYYVIALALYMQVSYRELIAVCLRGCGGSPASTRSRGIAW